MSKSIVLLIRDRNSNKTIYVSGSNRDLLYYTYLKYYHYKKDVAKIQTAIEWHIQSPMSYHAIIKDSFDLVNSLDLEFIIVDNYPIDSLIELNQTTLFTKNRLELDLLKNIDPDNTRFIRYTGYGYVFKEFTEKEVEQRDEDHALIKALGASKLHLDWYRDEYDSYQSPMLYNHYQILRWFGRGLIFTNDVEKRLDSTLLRLQKEGIIHIDNYKDKYNRRIILLDKGQDILRSLNININRYRYGLL